MGFLDSLGEFAGKLAAQAQEANKYKSQYERMSNHELKREYEDLIKKSNEFLRSEDIKYRLMAVKTILNDRRQMAD